jgi:glycerol-3-phosphate dehydrogenase
MTAYVMTFLDDAIDNVRMLPHVAAKHKKSGAGILAVKQIEDLRGERAWTIVISQS